MPIKGATYRKRRQWARRAGRGAGETRPEPNMTRAGNERDGQVARRFPVRSQFVMPGAGRLVQMPCLHAFHSPAE